MERRRLAALGDGVLVQAGRVIGERLRALETPAEAAGVNDGLYRVETRTLCAGFVVERGRVTQCAPILRRKLAYWQTIAKRVAP